MQNYSTNKLVISTLGHTWVLDLDGTIIKHNGYKDCGEDFFLPGSQEFLDSIPEKDMIVFLTSRSDEYRDLTEDFLKRNRVRYDHIIFNAPYGERILINDDKPSGLVMGIAVNKKRDYPLDLIIIEDLYK